MIENFSKIDEIDKKILDILKENSKEKIINISKKLGLPMSTIYNRIKRMEEEKIIEKYTLLINYKKLGFYIKSLIFIKYDPNSNISQKELLQNLLKSNNIEKGYIITGEWDILIIARFRNIDEMSSFILDRLRNFKGIKETYTMVILEES